MPFSLFHGEPICVWTYVRRGAAAAAPKVQKKPSAFGE